MKEEDYTMPTGVTILLTCLITFILTFLIRVSIVKPFIEEKEYSVREYLEHPEYYEVKKVYEDTNFVGYKVTYKK